MSEWLPIDSAPKDGTAILLAGGEDDNAKYAPPEEAEKMRVPCRAWWDGENWIITLIEACCCATVRTNPTHWMALPESPNA